MTLIDATPSQATVYNRRLRNLTTDKCLDIPGTDAPTMGTSVIQYLCGPWAAQRWDFVDGVEGFLIKNTLNPDLCLDAPGTDAPRKATVGFYPCQDTTADNQLWTQEWNSTGTAFLVVNVKSKRAGRPACLDVAGMREIDNFLRIGVYPCTTSLDDDHYWWFD
ncbi:RICIN domain-containing protein [Streptomyces sp. CB01881]|uniref:RICIN domain-containing protein n=1 Tax=Streptomyces sp. CB01881 TaxID=2078691 RepID=UPI00138681F9|nr:RICIN domain-containing protein [Streptomyces sp. CB01881]